MRRRADAPYVFFQLKAFVDKSQWSMKIVIRKEFRGRDMATGSFVAYYRTSTAKQSLGIDAQREAVARFLNGGSWTLTGEFEEHESGKNDARPALARAIDLCKRSGARLVVAKLDRLSRDVHFITGLQKSGVSFVCADMPEMDEFTAHIFAAMAQRERKLISSRTREGLAALKERGVTKTGKPVMLGNPNNGTAEQTAKANAGAKRKADAYADSVIAEIRKWQGKGITTYKDLADMLTGKVKTPRGEDRWQATQVKRIIERATT
jgi:DNA invertase Pin-like site-specific DNA recombinase